jgi:transposase
MQLREQIGSLKAELHQLKTFFKQDSDTSNQPPSKDPPWKPKSEREKSNRSSGGQKKHLGKTLEFSKTPDLVTTLPLTGQCECGQCWDSVGVVNVVAKQVHDLPAVSVQVAEYRAEVKICPRCSKKEQAAFPAGMNGYVQYGPNIMGMATYLHIEHHVPLFRTCQILGDIYGAWLSEGTIFRALNSASEQLVSLEFDQKLSAGLQACTVLHTDETGTKLRGKLSWIHVVSSKLLTCFGFHQKRGFEAISQMNILPHYKGTLAHDCWKPYFKLDLAQHAICWAHLSRELRGLSDQYNQDWAAEMLEDVQMVYHKLKEESLTLTERTAFIAGFQPRLEAVLTAHPEKPPLPKGLGKRGNHRVKQHPARTFALRLLTHQEACLRFLMDEACPFDNNQAERDIRRFCIRRKISGGFRTEESANIVCRLMSYASCVRKQGGSVWNGIRSLFSEIPLMPSFTPAE